MNASLQQCRSCGRGDLVPVLSLGRMPLANAFLRPEQLRQPEETYPLDLAFCPGCTLAQITETVPPERLFREYLYLSSFSDTALRNAALLAERMTAWRRLGAASLVVEIASNDGYLLQQYRHRGIPVLGIEPALNVARVAEARGVRTLSEFFGEALARQLSADGDQADVIHAHNVLAHVADLNGVVAGVRALLKSDGVAVVEVPYLKDLIDHVEFDTIYHEHLCYFSFTALDCLFRRHGLRLADVERIPVHGGSLRVLVQHHNDLTPANGRCSPSVRCLLEQEAAWGVHQAASYCDFVSKVSALRRDLHALLRELRAAGRRLAAYGASAKGSTLLNSLGIGRETLDFVVDRSTVKQGRYTPGSHLPIYAPDMLLEAQPDYVLLLSWNWADEILAQQAEYRRRGGRFIIPVPNVQVV